VVKSAGLGAQDLADWQKPGYLESRAQIAEAEAIAAERHRAPTQPREDPLVAVRQPDGTSRYVPRSQAVNMPVGSSAEQGGGIAGPFGGQGFDQQAMNIALDGAEKIRQGIPMSPREQATYEAARVHLMTPKTTVDQSSGQLFTNTPPYNFPPTGGATAGPQSAISAAPTQAGMPQPVPVAPGVTVTDVGGTRDQRKKVDEMTSAYNDIIVINKNLKDIIGKGINPADQEQIGKFNSARGDLMASLAKAQERGVLQPGEAEQMMETLGDLTSWTASIRNKTGIMDPVPRFTGFIDQQQATMAERLRNRAKEFGMTQEEIDTKLKQSGPSLRFGVGKAPAMLNGRPIVPNADNTGWVYQDSGEPAQ
jgi:hypothetical protein